MPMYEYACEDCDAQFEELMPSSATTCPPCPKCGSAKTRKLMSACRTRTGGSRTGATAHAASGGGCSGCAGGNCATCR